MGDLFLLASSPFGPQTSLVFIISGIPDPLKILVPILCLYLHFLCLAFLSNLQPPSRLLLVSFHLESLSFHVGHVAMWYECMSLVIAAGLSTAFFSSLPRANGWVLVRF